MRINREDGEATYVDAPAEGRHTCADDWVLADREDLLVLEDGKVIVGDRRELRGTNASSCQHGL